MNKTALANYYFKFAIKVINEADKPYFLEDIKRMAIIQAEKDLAMNQEKRRSEN